MKILFIWPGYPKFLFDLPIPIKNYFRYLSKFIFIRKPLSFPILAALTPEKHTIDVVEWWPSDNNFNKDYDLVGITCTTASAFLAYDIADNFRNQGIPVVLGGIHPSSLPEEAKEHADSVVVGEAEDTWPELLQDIEKNKLQPFYIQQRPVNIELTPVPKDVNPKGTGVGVQATRGCPYKCEFCSIPHRKFGNRYLMRPIDNVVNELRSYHDKLFTFQDNSLTVNVNYTKELFKKVKGLNKKFLAYGNIDILGKDDELLKLASEAGCVGWLIGFESVCQESLDSIGKQSNLVSEYLSSVKKIHDYGMMIEGSFVFGFDYDKSNIFRRTDEFVRKSEVDLPMGLNLTPFPGTPLFDRLEKDKRILTRNWSKYDGNHIVFRPKHMTPEELLTGTEELNRRWHRISGSLRRIIKNMNLGFFHLTETLSIEIFYRLFERNKYRRGEV